MVSYINFLNIVCLVNEQCSTDCSLQVSVDVVDEIEHGYHQGNPYHNAVHAADVTQAMNCYIAEQKVCSCIYTCVLIYLSSCVVHTTPGPLCFIADIFKMPEMS